MKKNFRKTLLWGGCFMALLSVFVACKDYDDDIAGLQEQITTNAGAIARLQELYNGGTVITSVTKEGSTLKVKLSDGTEYTLTDGKDANVWTIEEDGYWYLNGSKTSYKAIGQDGKDGQDGTNGTNGKDGKNGTNGKDGKNGTNGTNGKDGGYYRPNAATGNFDFVDAEGKVTPTNISWRFTTLTAVKDARKVTFTNIPGVEGSVSISLVLELKSLVFEPVFYYQGIEALEVPTFNYKKITVKGVDPDKATPNDAPTVGSAVSVAPDLAATYFLNPSNAEMQADATHYKFIAYNKAYTRAGNDLSNSFNIFNADLKEKGKVTVHASYSGSVIKDIEKDDEVTVLALQYNTGDTVVTSDFAAIKANIYQDFLLNNIKKFDDGKGHTNVQPNQHQHLYTTATSAIAAAPLVQVVWNNDKGIDLRDYVNTHRSIAKSDGTVQTADVAWDKYASDGLVEKDGFEYKFELVGYYAGSNQTSQSAHAAIASDGYTLRAQMPSGGKQQGYGYSESKKNNLQNAATQGKEPLVRVQLIDANGSTKQIVAVGYFKVQIVEDTPEIVDPTKPNPYEVDYSTETPNFTIECADNTHALMTLKWNDVEEDIIAKLNMSKDDFEKYYDLDMSTSSKAFQYNTATNDAIQRNPYLGNVELVADPNVSTMTNVLRWSITTWEAYEQFKNVTDGQTKELVTYVRYKLKNAANERTTRPMYFYVKLTWKPKQVNVHPSTAFGDSNKTKMYWYAADNNTAGSGYADIHGNVETVGTTTDASLQPDLATALNTPQADDEFMFDIKSTLVNNKLSVDAFKAPYTALNGNLKLTFGFVDGKGLKASTDGTKVYYGSTSGALIATIDPETGIVKYADNAKAKELLNAADHKELNKTVTAVVSVKATACDRLEIPVSNNTFNVKFLRPISAENGSATFEDAETNGSDADIQLTFIDWRDHKFVGDPRTKGQDYFKYYGVKEINVDIANARTNLNGNPTDKLSNITKQLSFKFNAPVGNGTQITAGNYGSLHYENNGVTVGTFKVWFPFTITYDWGTISGEIECTVGKTQNNAKRR